MPSRATRHGELWHHLTLSRGAAGTRPPDLARALRLHPDWPACPACRFPIDPAAGTTHPACATQTTRTDRCHREAGRQS